MCAMFERLSQSTLCPYNSPTERVVNYRFTTRTSRTGRKGRGLGHALQVSLMIYSSPTERLVKYCLTTRTSRTSRAGRGLVCTLLSLSNYIQFTN